MLFIMNMKHYEPKFVKLVPKGVLAHDQIGTIQVCIVPFIMLFHEEPKGEEEKIGREREREGLKSLIRTENPRFCFEIDP